MYRPDPRQQQQQQPLRATAATDRTLREMESRLMQDFQEQKGGPLTMTEAQRLSKTLQYYTEQVYQARQGQAPPQQLNREILSVTAQDFGKYLQRQEATRGQKPVQVVQSHAALFQDTAERFEQMSQDRNQTRALPPPPPDFQMTMEDMDKRPAAVLFEEAKKQREAEALRTSAAASASATSSAQAGVYQRITADESFRSQQEEQNRSSERALVQRAAAAATAPAPIFDTSLMVLPDRRELMFTPTVGRDAGQANGNPTLAQPTIAIKGSAATADLPQNVVVRENPIVSYREIENNLFIYSADRDWLRNSKENRYSFSVSFDPAANGQSFGPNLASQQKFKNIVRVELVKAILPGESLNVTVQRTTGSRTVNTGFQDNLLNVPFVTVRVAEFENNNYGTDNYLDRSFGVLQYDAQWISDSTMQGASTRGYLAMIPKHLKCQKEYYPTPLSTLQKMTIELRRPNGDLVSTAPDTFDVGGILAPQTGEVLGGTFPFTNSIKFGESPLSYNVMVPSVGGAPANFFVNTAKYFSRFELAPGDRVQISGYTYTEGAFEDPTYGSSLREFCRWVNRAEGHIVLDVAHSIATDLSTDTTNIRDSYNDVGYANFVVLQGRYQDPTTGSVLLQPFGANFGATLNSFGAALQSPVRMMNLNKQLQLVFRIITREMDSVAQLRPDNNY